MSPARCWPALLGLLLGACADAATPRGVALDAGQDGVTTAGDLCPTRGHPASAATALAAGFTVADVLAFTVGTHDAPLDWYRRDGIALPNTRITMTMTLVGVPLVVPGAETAIDRHGGPVTCLEHVLITGQAHLTTQDGQFDETFSLTLRSADARMARGTVTFPASAFHGTFSPPVGPDACLAAVTFSFAMTPAAFSGEFTLRVAQAACDRVVATTPIERRGGGWWGADSFQKADAGVDTGTDTSSDS